MPVLRIVLALACVASAGAVVATAQESGPSGFVHACAGADGVMRALPASDTPCRAGEQHVDWSAAGPDGPRGVAGPRGGPGESLPGYPGAPGEAAVPRRVTAELVKYRPERHVRHQDAEFEAIGYYQSGCERKDVRETDNSRTLWMGVQLAQVLIPPELNGGKGTLRYGYAPTLKQMDMTLSPWKTNNQWRVYQRDHNFANVDGRGLNSAVNHVVYTWAKCYDPPGELAAPPRQPTFTATTSAVVQLTGSSGLQAMSSKVPDSKGRLSQMMEMQSGGSGSAVLRPMTDRARTSASKVLGRGKFRATTPGLTKLTVQLTAAARRLLRRRGRIDAKLVISGRGTDGARLRARVQVELLRKGVKPRRGRPPVKPPLKRGAKIKKPNVKKLPSVPKGVPVEQPVRP